MKSGIEKLLFKGGGGWKIVIIFATVLPLQTMCKKRFIQLNV